MRSGPTIGSMYDVLFGLKSGDDAKFLHFVKGKHAEDKPLLRGDDVRRYGVQWRGEYVWYAPRQMTKHRALRITSWSPSILVQPLAADDVGGHAGSAL